MKLSTESGEGHHPERFVRNPPTPAALPQAVWINPPAKVDTVAAQ